RATMPGARRRRSRRWGDASIRGYTSGEPVEAAEHHAEDDVRDDDGDRRGDAVVQREKAGRLELARHGRAVLFARHARVDPGHEAHADGEHEHRVEQADEAAEPEGGAAEHLKGGDVEQREEPAVDEVDAEADDLGAI